MTMQKDQKAFLVLGALAGITALTTLTAATEYAASALAYQRALGEPLLKLGTTFLYPPWACMDWFRRFHLQAPRIFAVVRGIAFGGGLISFLLLLGAITRLRGRPVSTAHGSARWATEPVAQLATTSSHQPREPFQNSHGNRKPTVARTFRPDRDPKPAARVFENGRGADPRLPE
jgi:type IV secretory pathway TraG/TraD family ATPase VirD4